MEKILVLIFGMVGLGILFRAMGITFHRTVGRTAGRVVADAYRYSYGRWPGATLLAIVALLVFFFVIGSLVRAGILR